MYLRISVTNNAGSADTMNVIRQPKAGAKKLPMMAASPTPSGAPVCISAP